MSRLYLRKALTLGLVCVLVVLFFPPRTTLAWYDEDWVCRKGITIDHTKVEADLTGFPVLVSLDSDGDLASSAQDDGDDILFADASDNKLSHEIEYFDGATGRLIAWVNVPSLSSTEDTTFYMYFGNDTAANQEDVEGTWNGDYVMVQHLEESAGTHHDSTSNHNDGTTVLVTDQDATGWVNGADEFDGTDDYIRVPNDASLQFGEGSFTAEAWIYPHSIPDSGGARVVNNRGTGAGGSYRGYQLKIKNTAGGWYLSDAGIDDATGNYQAYDGTTTYGYNQWYRVVMVYDADNELAYYVNGASDGTLSVGSYGSLTNNLPTAIGGSIAHQGVEGANNRQFFDGIIDEVRLSTTARSAGWVLTSYANQSDPSTFYSVGELELSSGPPEISNPVPADDAMGVSVSLAQLSFDLYDPDGEPMDYTVTTTPDIGSGSATGVGDGTHTVAISGLAHATTYTWTISATDGTDVTNQSYSFTTERPPGPWWNSDWSYRKVIRVDHTRVMDDLADFPLLIEIDDGSLASFVKDDAGDVVFTDYDGTQLDHEIESYTSATGALVAWVRVPSLSSTEDTLLYMYYGNSEAVSQENAEAVWDSDFVMVQHLDETDGTHYDSTSYSNDGVPHGLASQDVAGKIDGADEFLGSGDLVDVGTDSSMDVFGPGQDFSISLWVNRDDAEDVQGFFSSGSSATNGIYFGIVWQNFDDLRFLSPGNTADIQSASDPIGDTDWHYVGLTADRDGDMEFWVDGVAVHSASIAAYASENWNRVDDTYKIGTDRSESASMDGVLDEVRVSKVVRSAAWMATSYNNQSDPGSFYGISQEPSETYPAPTVTLVSPADGAAEEVPATFSFVPQCQSSGGCSRAELWLNVTETSDGEVVYSDDTYAPQRAVIKNGKMYQSEGTGHGCRIVVRDFPEGNILKQSPVFGGSNHTNTSVVIEGDVIYGMTTDGRMMAWNEVTETVVWEISVGPGGGYSTTANSMEVYDGHIYVQSGDFVIHKIDMLSGTEVDSLALESGGSNRLKAHMLVDYENDRLYALGDSHYYAIDLTTFTETWSIPIVAHGGRETRGGPILVNDAHSEQYLTIFTTFPQEYTYAVGFDGTIVWTWTGETVRAVATYNPNTGLVYVTGATGYSDSGVNLLVPGSVYALHVNDGSLAWVSHGDGTDKFARPITASGNYLIFKTDNNASTDYLYVLDATTGAVLAKVSAGGNRGYWCFPPALSGGYVAVGGGYASQGGNSLDIFHIGDGEFVDYYPLHADVHHTGYVPNALTSLGLTETSWRLVKENDSPIVEGVVNSIEFDFTGYAVPQTMDWNIRLSQSDNQSAWGVEREVTLLPKWYDDSWLGRRMIVIGHTQVNDDLTDFPVLIDLTDEGLAFHAQDDGDDILFADPFGAKLDHEIERYDDGSGRLLAWVKVPFLSSTQDTVLYMYYGNAGASNQENVEGVWDNGFVMVQHLEEASGAHFDSTAYANHGTTVFVTDQNAPGKIDGADDFDGTGDYIRVPDDDSLQFGEGSFTAEAWIYPNSVPDSGGARIVNNRGTGPGGQYAGWQFKIADANTQWRLRDACIDDASGDYKAYDGATTYSYDQWYHVVMVYEADDRLQFYVNGGVDGTVSVGDYGSISNALPTAIGGSIADGGIEGADNRQFFDGIIDEVRLSDVARGAAWVAAESSNQGDPGSFAISPEADLSLSKEVDDDSVGVGDEVVFTVGLSNGGPGAATGVQVEDALPGELSLVSASADLGSYSEGVWSIGLLPADAEATLTITATVEDWGSFTNTAQVRTADQYDPDSTPGNSLAGEDDQASVGLSTPEADLSLAKEVDDERPNVGDDVVFTIVLSNGGPDTATGIEVADALPGELGLVAASADRGTYGAGVWSVGLLPGGEEATLSITATVENWGSFTNTAQVRAADQHDPDSTPGNSLAGEDDQSSVSLTTQQADLSLSKEVDDERPNVGDDVVFTVVLANAGPDVATGVEVVDALPGGLSLVSASADQGSYSAGVWSVGLLPGGAEATLSVTATVDQAGSFTNTAQVRTAEQYDPDSTPGNSLAGEDDQSSASLTTQQADLSLSKEVDDDHLDVGDDVVFTVGLSNAGPDAATGVEVEDALPVGLSLVAASADRGTYGAGVWSVGLLPGGEEATLTITATVDQAGSFVNTAQVRAADQHDPDSTPGNGVASEDDQASASLTTQEADLSLSKEVDNDQPNVGEEVVFTVVLSNAGPDAATGVEVEDALPVGLSLVSASADLGSYSAGVWSVVSLVSGEEATLVIAAVAETSGSFTNTAQVRAADQYDPDSTPGNGVASEDDQAAAGIRVEPAPAPEGSTVYLPLVSGRSIPLAPDLVVDRVVVASDSAPSEWRLSEGVGVQVVIKNQGQVAVTADTPFWVDLYVNPHPVPTGANQTWDALCSEGMAWGVNGAALPLEPGEELALVHGDAYYRSDYSSFSGSFAAGVPIYVQVDSANAGTTHGAVLESHEIAGGAYNNISGPVYLTSVAGGVPESSGDMDTGGLGDPGIEADRLPPRP